MSKKKPEDALARSANKVDRHVGQTIRARRLEIGQSQEALAEALDVTFQQVQKYEKGVNRVAASRLYDIAEAQGMPAGAYFPKSRTAPSAEETLASFLESPLGVRLATAFKSASPSLQRHIVELVETIASEAKK